MPLANSSRENERELVAIVERCLDLPGKERAGYLLDALGTDRNRLETALDLLLASEEAANLATPAFVPRPSEAATPTQPVKTAEEPSDGANDPLGLPGFRVLDKLGEGGMGTVYLAEQLVPVRRRVAIKVARFALDSEGQERLAAERQAMARLSHPNIAQILEAGSTAEGCPYFVMELIEGAPIHIACDRERLDLRRRLRLFLGVCAGVQHAHQKGILHRDLKPSNVLVAEIGGELQAKIIDFGVAKALGEPLLTERAALTRGNLIGTPAYMSPEALSCAEELGAAVDTRSDVYSLGVLLFELLIGELPMPRKPGENPLVHLQRLAKREVGSPLLRWNELDEPARRERALQRDTSPRLLADQLRRDLEWIVLKALAHDADARYASVSELAADLERYLADEAVLAGRPSSFYKLRKLARRHRLAVAAAAMLVFVLAAGLVARTIEARRANREAAEAKVARDESNRMVGFLLDLFTASDPAQSGGRELSARDLLQQGAERLMAEDFSEIPRVKARLLFSTAQVFWRLGDPREGLRQAEAALEFTRVHLGEEDPIHAFGLFITGTIASETGDYPRSERMLRESLSAQERIHGYESAEVANVFNNLGAIHEEMTRYPEARDFYERAYKIRRKVFGAEAVPTAQILESMSVVNRRLGRLAEAEAAQRHVIEVLDRLLPAHHPDLFLYRRNLADTLIDVGNFGEAESLLLESLDRSRVVLGEDHPQLGHLRNSLGNCYLLSGRWQEADQAFRQVHANYVAAVGKEHRLTAYPLANLGLVYYYQGRFDEAESFSREALAIRQRNDEAPLDTVVSQLAVGRALLGQGRLEEAETFLRQAVERLENAQTEPVDRRSSRAYLALLLTIRGDFDAARPLLEKAFDQAKPDEEQDTAILFAKARLCWAEGKGDRARELADLARRRLERSYPPDLHLLAPIERFRASLAELETNAQRDS